jgi:3-phenylpropionate/cinnamic acid dioxygenase small subunit
MSAPTDDRLDVIELFARLARLLDENRHDDIHTVYTEDVEVRSPRVHVHGIDEVTTFLREAQVADERTQHIHGNVLVDLDGDEARASANQLVYYFRDGEPPHQTSSVELAYKAVRTAAGWRFREGRITLVWTHKS